MANNELGKLRRSAVISMYGPGAIIDFRAGGHGGGPISAVGAGLDKWDEVEPRGLRHPQTIFEPRLQRKLGVAGFRLPPVYAEDEAIRARPLYAARFPAWLQCPVCSTLRRGRNAWAHDPGDPAPYCASCSAQKGQRVHVVPVRFICACDRGHLDEFPWDLWVGHQDSCRKEGALKLEAKGAGLAGLVLKCSECGSARNMEGIFSREALKGLTCRGYRQWLGGDPEQCDRPIRVLQRGASNTYFPVSHSALDIPPWSDSIQKKLGQFWDAIVRAEAGRRREFIETLMPVIGDVGFTAAGIADEVERRLALLESPSSENLRWDEYQHFTSGKPTGIEEDTEFEIRPADASEGLEGHLCHVVRAMRLREVRAVSGFTRIFPAAGDVDRDRIAPITLERRNWLPAIEVRGEGIFVSLNMERLRVWESQPGVEARIALIRERYLADLRERRDEEDIEADRDVSARLVMIHTLAHALIKQLSLDCGYSSASLRERLYVEREPNEMAGLLIYTSAPDADGTLGGLARQGLIQRFEPLFVRTIRGMAWCSADPLCIEGLNTSEPTNLAACHSCALVSETSCEEFNRFLDRALLVGTPAEPRLGFFHDLVHDE
jgi:hypothetical protein